MLRDGHKTLLTRLGARLGLLALVLQLVLSFGHVHPLPAPIASISAPADSSVPDLPQADGACAICASMAAFAALDLPHHIDFAAPLLVESVLAPAQAVAEHRPAPIRHFSSRAPPSI